MEAQDYENLKEQLKVNKPDEERLREMTDAEVSEEFFNKYKALCMKYKRDFMQKPPEIFKLDIKK